MTKQQKITLSASRDIPLNKLVLSQSNVRHVKAGGPVPLWCRPRCPFKAFLLHVEAYPASQ